jgi:hypothetical protein
MDEKQILEKNIEELRVQITAKEEQFRKDIEAQR